MNRKSTAVEQHHVTPRNSSSSLRRALGLIETIAEGHDGGGYSLTSLAAESGLGKSTAIRLLAPLREYGYVDIDTDSGRYRLGPTNARLGNLYLADLDLRTEAADILRELALETGETVHLLVPYGTWMVYVDKFDSPSPVQMASRIGARQPMHSTASGIAYLARADEAAIEAVLTGDLESRTPNTPSTPETLRSAVSRARQRGFAIDDITNEPHIRGIAAVIIDAEQQPVAAVSVVGPDYSLTPDRFDELGDRVIAAAHHVSARLGARTDRTNISSNGS